MHFGQEGGTLEPTSFNARAGALKNIRMAEGAECEVRRCGARILLHGKLTHREICLRVPRVALRGRPQGLPEVEGRRVWSAA